VINGAGADRLPNILNVSVPHADQEAVLIGLDLEGVAASGASACQSGAVTPSHVLSAMGRVHDGDAEISFSLCHSTKGDDVAYALLAVALLLNRVRAENAVPA
jgi:cysteine desulfurase